MVVRVRVVGGPCGKPITTPNSARKRGWSMTQALWRFETGEELPPVVNCGHEPYVLRYNDKGQPLYVHQPDVALRRVIALAVGRQRLWLARFPELR